MDQRPMSVEIKKANETEVELAATEKRMAEVVAAARARRFDPRPLTVKVAEALGETIKPETPAPRWDDRPLGVKLGEIIEQSKRG